LGVGTDHPGIYGDTSAYYGTVEQQGHLTLHLHLLLWIKGNLSPQEMRRRILDPNSQFRQDLVSYLESLQVGEFLTGTQSEVVQQVERLSKSKDYVDPTQTLPTPPPSFCSRKCGTCRDCSTTVKWMHKYVGEVDDLLLKSNVHRCSQTVTADSNVKVRRYIGCMDNKWGKCKAHFPRPICKETEVDPETGSLTLKKLEPMMNTVTAPLTYLLRCNTDVTCLKSGTAIKAVIMYVTDYVTKCSLKTHVMFDVIRSTYQRNAELIGGSALNKERAR
jgi:hypothetical protein